MSTGPLPYATSGPKPVRMLYAVVAGLSALTTASAFTDLVPRYVVGILGLVVLFTSTVLGVYTEGQVTPWQNVAAKLNDKTGALVAGPASDVRTGAVVTVEADTGPASPYTPPDAAPGAAL